MLSGLQIAIIIVIVLILVGVFAYLFYANAEDTQPKRTRGITVEGVKEEPEPIPITVPPEQDMSSEVIAVKDSGTPSTGATTVFAPPQESVEYTPPPPPKEVTFTKIGGHAYYLGGLAKTAILDVSTIPVTDCQAACAADPNCKSFFHQTRSGLGGGGYSFAQGSCVRLNTGIWPGTAPGSDAYNRVETMRGY